MISKSPVTDIDLNDIADTPLHLSSLLPPEILTDCSPRLVSMEKDLRIGQCRDSLVQLRTKLSAQARLIKYKRVNVRHQVPNTRSKNLINRINTKIGAAATKYRRAFMALQALDQCGSSEWCSEFLELKTQDVRGLSEAALPDAATQERAVELQARTLLNGGAVPEGNRTVSWIWRGSLKSGSEDEGGHDEYGEGWSSFR